MRLHCNLCCSFEWISLAFFRARFLKHHHYFSILLWKFWWAPFLFLSCIGLCLSTYVRVYFYCNFFFVVVVCQGAFLAFVFSLRLFYFVSVVMFRFRSPLQRALSRSKNSRGGKRKACKWWLRRYFYGKHQMPSLSLLWLLAKKKDIEILLEINFLVSLSSEHVGTVFSLEQKNVKHWHYTAMQRN